MEKLYYIINLYSNYLREEEKLTGIKSNKSIREWLVSQSELDIDEKSNQFYSKWLGLYDQASRTYIRPSTMSILPPRESALEFLIAAKMADNPNGSSDRSVDSGQSIGVLTENPWNVLYEGAEVINNQELSESNHTINEKELDILQASSEPTVRHILGTSCYSESTSSSDLLYFMALPLGFFHLYSIYTWYRSWGWVFSLWVKSMLFKWIATQIRSKN